MGIKFRHNAKKYKKENKMATTVSYNQIAGETDLINL